MAPATIKAIVASSLNKVGIATVPTPKLRDDYVLVKTLAVGLNPVDWQQVYLGIGGDPSGTRVGFDYVGIVEEVGSKVTKSFKKGDRIAGPAHGGNAVQHEDGAFAEYIVVKGDLQIKVPDNVSDEGAATLGVGVSTVGQALYQSLKLSQLPSSPEPVLIYGGGTATGILAIQFAKASGYKVLTTASPRHEAYLKNLGADAVFDYNNPEWPSEVKAATQGQLKFAFDCIGTAETAKATGQAMSDAEGARYSTTEDPGAELIKTEYPHISAEAVLAMTAWAEEFVWGEPGKEETLEVQPQDFEFAKIWWERARELLESGQVKPARTIVDQGGRGLDGVLIGLEELHKGNVRGSKLVYHL